MADVLGTAFANGRITFEEHDERLTLAYAARTFSELDVLTADLVTPSASAEALTSDHRQGQVPERRFAANVPAAGPVLNDSTTVMSTLRPGSPLHVPAQTNLVVILGDAKIDLVNATFASAVVCINLNVFMGDVKIRVPEGVHIVSALSNIMSEFKTRDLSFSPSSVTVELHGTMVMGNVKVLGPCGRPGKYERFVR